jgi:hypothetical protein
MATVSNPNAAIRDKNGLGPRTLIVKIVDSGDAIANDDLESIINYMTTSHGVGGAGDSAFSVAAIEGAGTDTVYVALQGTGDLTVADADMGVADTTVSIEATFG